MLSLKWIQVKIVVVPQFVIEFNFKANFYKQKKTILLQMVSVQFLFKAISKQR